MSFKPALSVALWCANLDYPVGRLDDWLALLRRQMQKAAAEGADILLIPEHISDGWYRFLPAGIAEKDELDWIAAQAEQALPHMQQMAIDAGIALAAGSVSCKDAQTGRNRNRAWMFFPDRDAVFHDKMVMTPSENAPDGWQFEIGDSLAIFEWRGWRMAIVICLEIEMPHLAHRLSQSDVDMVLVPSMTALAAGYHRVFNCARARAVELMAAVCVVGGIGGQERSHSGAAVYLPCEAQFGHTGVMAEIPVHNSIEGAGHMLLVRDIPLAAIRDLRRGIRKAEAWPGPWPADHVKIIEA